MKKLAWNYFPDPNAEMTPGLPPNALAVYLSLLHHAGRRSGACFPSYRTIGAEAGLSRNSSSKYIHLLEQRGLIVTEHRTAWDAGTIKGPRREKGSGAKCCDKTRPKRQQNSHQAFKDPPLQSSKSVV